MTGRIGFCCSWVSSTHDENEELLMNQRTTTITSLSKLSSIKATDKLLGLVRNNMDTLERAVEWVGNLPEGQRMFRIGSDILPAYTHEVAEAIYQLPDMRDAMETGFAKIGQVAREYDVRLSFHPGQYCLLNTLNPVAKIRAIKEFEYHVDMMRMMGYTGGWHPHGAAINIHVGSRAGGVDGFIEGLKELSSDGQNLITVENDEYSFGLDSMEPIAEHCPIVLDIHHEWVFSGGEYIQADDPRIQYVKDSWRGVRPLGHYSLSRETVLRGAPTDVQPDFNALRLKGFSLRDLRAHSEMCWNTACNDWAISHLDWMDIEVEAKQKNLASEQLYQQWQASKKN